MKQEYDTHATRQDKARTLKIATSPNSDALTPAQKTISSTQSSVSTRTQTPYLLQVALRNAIELKHKTGLQNK